MTRRRRVSPRSRDTLRVPLSGRRRGTVYVAVLSLSLLRVTLSVGTLLAVRAQVRNVDLGNDIAEARLYARSGIELGRLWVDQDPSWRSNRTSGNWVTGRAMGTGTFSLDGTNFSGGGALTDNELESLVLTATGQRGRARQKVRATLAAVQTPYTSLSAALVAGSGISFQSATVSGTGMLIASNGSITASNCSISPNVEAVGTISGGTYAGTIRAASRARTMPRANVFDYYIANGTPIAWTSLASGTMSGALLSPSSNPYGTEKNLRGIYVIDCQGRATTVSNCRIVGTLVLLNPGAGSVVQGSINLNPAIAGYPSLLVRGDITLRPSANPLSETSLDVNFNPAGTAYPYPSGSSNATNTDTYPSYLGGMIYVSGNTTLGSSANIGMLIGGGTLTVTSAVSTLGLNFDNTYAATPPPGFSAIRMVLSEGSYVQVVDP